MTLKAFSQSLLAIIALTFSLNLSANQNQVDPLIEKLIIQIDITEQARMACYNSVTVNKDPKQTCYNICSEYMDEILVTEALLDDPGFDQKTKELMVDAVDAWKEFYDDTATYCGTL